MVQIKKLHVRRCIICPATCADFSSDFKWALNEHTPHTQTPQEDGFQLSFIA